jgi:hypothetical protein
MNNIKSETNVSIILRYENKCLFLRLILVSERGIHMIISG